MAKNKFSACLGCEDRQQVCHATCEKYLAEVERYNKEKEQIQEARNRNGEYIAYTRQRSRRFR